MKYRHLRNGTGRRIVENEQSGRRREGYGEALLKKLSADLTSKFGRGFSRQNLQQMRQFYRAYPPTEICQTVSGKFPLDALQDRFSLPWSVYVRFLSLKSKQARAFYEEEALRGGWSVRQLDRQIVRRVRSALDSCWCEIGDAREILAFS